MEHSRSYTSVPIHSSRARSFALLAFCGIVTIPWDPVEEEVIPFMTVPFFHTLRSPDCVHVVVACRAGSAPLDTRNDIAWVNNMITVTGFDSNHIQRLHEKEFTKQKFLEAVKHECCQPPRGDPTDHVVLVYLGGNRTSSIRYELDLGLPSPLPVQDIVESLHAIPHETYVIVDSGASGDVAVAYGKQYQHQRQKQSKGSIHFLTSTGPGESAMTRWRLVALMDAVTAPPTTASSPFEQYFNVPFPKFSELVVANLKTDLETQKAFSASF
eukprot:PhF_6_TR37678/c0_g1_i1/m.56072